jgi:putative addiction module component (TIGR02574 family)
MPSELTEQAKKLSISDRINLVEEIWDSIAEENQAFGRTWEEIKAEFMILEARSTCRIPD